MMEYASELIDYTNDGNFKEIKKIFKEEQNLNLSELLDDQENTILQLACMEGSTIIVQNILKYHENFLKNNPQPNQSIKSFILHNNALDFNSLHLASFNGHLDLLKEFVKKVDNSILGISNSRKLTPMHTAAQGNNPVILAYLKEQGFNINILDSVSRSPLHWAAYQGSEISAIFLIAWGAKLEQPDSEINMTPLHLAVQEGSVRITKKLLLKGVKKNVLDKKGLTPLDIAQENEFKTIISMLHDQTLYQKCHGLKQELKKPSKYAKQYIAFLVLQALCAGLTCFFVAPYIESYILIGVFFILTWLIVTFLVLTKQNPGKLRPKNQKSQKLSVRLSQLEKIEDFCPECEIIKPQRSRHCDYCNSCIKVLDHHCPWINNCVGAYNHKYFYCMLWSVFISMIFQLVMQGLYLGNKHLNWNDSIFIKPEIEKPDTEYKLYNILHIVSSCFVMFICFAFILHLGALIVMQTKNLLEGKTTNEQFSLKFQKQNQEEEEEEEQNVSNIQDFDEQDDLEQMKLQQQKQKSSRRSSSGDNIYSNSSNILSINSSNQSSKQNSYIPNKGQMINTTDQDNYSTCVEDNNNTTGLQQTLLQEDKIKQDQINMAREIKGNFWWIQQSKCINCLNMLCKNQQNDEFGEIQY